MTKSGKRHAAVTGNAILHDRQTIKEESLQAFRPKETLLRILKKGSYLLSRIAVQYHRRKWT